METIIQLLTVTTGGNIQASRVEIEEAVVDAANPRLRFARKFLQSTLCDHYPVLHPGDSFKEESLLFSFTVRHVHITRVPQLAGEKRVVITGVFSG